MCPGIRGKDHNEWGFPPLLQFSVANWASAFSLSPTDYGWNSEDRVLSKLRALSPVRAARERAEWENGFSREQSPTTDRRPHRWLFLHLNCINAIRNRAVNSGKMLFFSSLTDESWWSRWAPHVRKRCTTSWNGLAFCINADALMFYSGYSIA